MVKPRLDLVFVLVFGDQLTPEIVALGAAMTRDEAVMPAAPMA